MAVGPSQPVTQADADTLAALANTVLLPLVNAAVGTNSWPMHQYDYQYWVFPQATQPPYEFALVGGSVTSPLNLSGIPVYGPIGGGGYLSPQTISLNVYAFKLVGGRKSFCLTPVSASATGNQPVVGGPADFNMQWTWQPPVGGADGYLVEQATLNRPRSYFYVTAPSFLDTGFGPVLNQHNPISWNSTLNRIRADYFNLVNTLGLGADDRFFNSDNLVSGPWCVSINDPDIYPSPGGNTFVLPESIQFGFFSNIYPDLPISGQGELYGTLYNNSLGTATVSPYFTGFKNVNFIYSQDDALLGLTVGQGRRIDVGYLTLNTDVTVSYHADLPGHLTMLVWWQVGWNGGGTPPVNPPNVNLFNVSASPSDGVVWSTVGSVTSGVYALVATVNLDLSAGDGTIHFVVSGTGQYVLAGSGPLITARMIYATNSVGTPLSGLHPTSTVLNTPIQDMPEGPSQFILNGGYAISFWNISHPKVKGMWLASTLPVPAINTFLDVDMPPYVGAVRADIFHGSPVAVSPVLPDVLNTFIDNPPTNVYDVEMPTLASTMRQQSLVRNGDKTQIINFPGTGPVQVVIGPKFNLVSRTLQPQSAQWLVMKDTDPMPLIWGGWGNPHQTLSVISAVSLAPAASFLGGISVPGEATAVKITLRKHSTINGGGKLYDAGSLTSFLNIFISHTGFPNPVDPATYDFKTTNNQVVIPPNGGPSYLATIRNSGFNYLVRNTNPSTTVLFDIIIEIDTGVVPRQPAFLPTTYECFSNIIDGAPPTPFGLVLTDLKPVPQQGYVIFKVRASRVPVQNDAGIAVTPASGPIITVRLGQNKLQFDGTWKFAPFFSDNTDIGVGNSGATGAGGDADTGAGGAGTPYDLVIPANARDTGDVEVLWPVVFGNPLVYHCDVPVIVEAWACWQPVFYAAAYGFVSFLLNLADNFQINFNPTAFPFCTAFSNFFNTDQTNYPRLHGTDEFGSAGVSLTQYPVSSVLYNDLEKCLNLI